MVKLRIFIAVLFTLTLLTGCSEETVIEPAVTQEDNIYATYIQKNNRTVRVKTFDAELVDYNTELPTDKYIRFGMYYDSYATPDEIKHYVMNKPAGHSDVCLQPASEAFGPDYRYDICTSIDTCFKRQCLETVMKDYPATSMIISGGGCYYDNTTVYTYSTTKGALRVIITQTVEDVKVGSNVWSIYVGVDTLFE